MSIGEDREIVARVLPGDKAAFRALIERHRASALAFSRRMLDADEAEDAVQEAFLAAFLGLKALRDAGRFRAWILGIVGTSAATGFAGSGDATFTMSWVARW